MQLANRTLLDTERNALRDQFDAIWLASTTIGEKESRAIRCAAALDRPNYQPSNECTWRIFPGGRGTQSGPILA